jgi:hypothetical protein
MSFAPETFTTGMRKRAEQDRDLRMPYEQMNTVVPGHLGVTRSLKPQPIELPAYGGVAKSA